MRMDHTTLREAIFAGERNASVLSHLEMCPTCASLAEELDRVDRMAASLIVPPPSLGVQRRILDHVLVDYDRHSSTREAIFAGDRDASVLAHLETCPDCASLAEELERVDRVAASLIVPPPSPGVQRRILDRVLRHYDRHSSMQGTIVAGDKDPARRAREIGVSPGFHEDLHELSDEVVRSAVGTWLSLVDETMHPAHQSGDVWSCPFEAEDRWHCLLVGIGWRGNVQYLVALRVVIACDAVPAREIEEAQAEWDGWGPALRRDMMGGETRPRGPDRPVSLPLGPAFRSPGPSQADVTGAP
jgi:hypothetical protein